MVGDPPPDDPRGASDDGADASSYPLEDLVKTIRSRASVKRSHESQEYEDGADSLFEDRSVDSVASEAVWENLDSSRSDRDSTIDDGEGAEHVVSKRWYCERCEYFSDPPDVSCSHEGTQIIEFVDTEAVRVRNCPIVKEREALGDHQ